MGNIECSTHPPFLRIHVSWVADTTGPWMWLGLSAHQDESPDTILEREAHVDMLPLYTALYYYKLYRKI